MVQRAVRLSGGFIGVWNSLEWKMRAFSTKMVCCLHFCTTLSPSCCGIILFLLSLWVINGMDRVDFFCSEGKTKRGTEPFFDRFDQTWPCPPRSPLLDLIVLKKLSHIKSRKDILDDFFLLPTVLFWNGKVLLTLFPRRARNNFDSLHADGLPSKKK